MSHFTALVLLPPDPGAPEDDSLNQAIERLMAPYDENRSLDYDPDEFWDYWRITDDHEGILDDAPRVREALPALDAAFPDHVLCWTLVTGEGVLHRERYDPDAPPGEWFTPTPDFDERVWRILEGCPECRLVAVDYHS